MAADAVLLVAYGGPRRPDEIRPFLQHVTRGRRVPPERLEEVAHHYERLGGRSPLNELTFRQAEGLRRALGRTPVYVGMRAWEPFVAGTLAQMALDGVRRAVCIILAPHACDASRERYLEAIDEGRAGVGPRAPAIDYVRSWHAHPLFVETWADTVAAALEAIETSRRREAPLLFTAHSIPLPSAEASAYVQEVHTSARAVSERLGHTRWQVAWQSRSGNPRDPWLEPDVNLALRALAASGTREVVLAPIGFVCDHVEVLYDLDVEAQQTAGGLGLTLARASTPNDHPLFVRMLAEVARQHLG